MVKYKDKLGSLVMACDRKLLKGDGKNSDFPSKPPYYHPPGAFLNGEGGKPRSL